MKLYIYLIIYFSVLIAHSGHAEISSRRFKHITYAEGLNNSNVYAFCQDEQGFLWIGTDGGLFRYDGYKFKEYKNYINDTNSINSNVVFSLLNDSKGNLWIGTYKGLMMYNREQDNFIDFKIADNFFPDRATPVENIIEVKTMGILVASEAGGILIDPDTYEFDFDFYRNIKKLANGNHPLTFYYSPDKILWVSTLNGIYAVNLSEKSAKHYQLSALTGIGESDIVLDFYEDSFGDLWLSTRGGGLLCKKSESNTFIPYLHDKNNPHSIGSNECYDFWESNNGELWVTTNGSGINFFNRNENSFRRLTSQSGIKFGLLNNNTRTIFEDRQGNLWISSFQAGINLLVNSPYNFNFQTFELGGDKGFESTSVISFQLDHQNILWVGTDGGGLKRIDRATGDIVTFQPLSENGHVFPDKVVMNIFQDEFNKLWMGTYLEGLIEFDPKTWEYRQFKNNPDNSNSISSNFITVIKEDRQGNLWIGTNGGGLNLYNRDKDHFIRFQNSTDNKAESLVNDYVNVIEEDVNGDLWLGTYWGISRFNTQKLLFTNYLVQKDNKEGLNSNIIFSLLNDSKNRLWIGTQSGLARFDFDKNKFIHYAEVPGISSNQINGILEDKNGKLWISTDNGIMNFNPETLEAIRYTEEDGLQGNEFYHNSCYKGANGELFFGGYNGFNSFFADFVQKRYYEPDVIVTSLKVFDKEIVVGDKFDGKVILDKNITLTEEITLKYSHKSFTLGFSAIDFIEGNKEIYFYKLENFDSDWNETNSKYPFATYTNIAPGKYTLRVKAGKREFIDQIEKETRIYITIEPPLWGTWWAYFTYTMVILSMLFYFWRLTLVRLKEKNEIKLEKLKRENVEGIAQARMQFFTNISHEIRTPLTLIIGPLEHLLKKGKEVNPFRKQFYVMHRSAERLLSLVNQLLDLRKIELDKMELRAVHADISVFVKEIIFSFEDLARDKKINLQYHSQPQSIKVWYDPEKLDQILFNLLSNAFKYTPERGQISINLTNGVRLEEQPFSFLEIHISDTGMGIKQKDLKNIFDRFYQGSRGDTSSQGWGLGLSLTNSFVKLHRGVIKVKSAENIGTHFRVYIPNGEEHLQDSEKIQNFDADDLIRKSRSFNHISTPEREEKYSKPPIRAANRSEVLIVEDNTDLRRYLLSELEQFFNCNEAADGNAGIEMAIDILPDIIISDVMMPGLSGVELCQQIKENIITSHIPVVLLTAKSNVADRIMGYDSGADAYISKPFNIDNLIANVNSILANRQKLREKFSSYLNQNKKIAPVSIDNKFFNTVDCKVIENISNPLFGVEELALEIGMSRAHLHRKLKAITGKGPNEYIRKLRMEKAADLLLQGDKNIAEVSLEVGYNSSSYFSSTFKSYFRVSPKTFIEKNGGGMDSLT